MLRAWIRVWNLKIKSTLRAASFRSILNPVPITDTITTAVEQGTNKVWLQNFAVKTPLILG